MLSVISSLLPHALNYADKWGWSVFPAPVGEKKSHKAEKYSGTKWGATRDPDEIQRNFTKWPNANIGIPTGAENGFFVLDVDTIDGHGRDGFASLEKLKAEHGEWPDTLIAESPSGSKHYYFKHPGFEVKNSESEIADGIDIRGDGGMVLVHPSRKPDGGAYEWLNAPHEIAEAPQWLREWPGLRKTERSQPSGGTVREAPTGLRPAAGTQAARVLALACENVAAASEGERNGELNKQAGFAGRWVANGEIAADVATHDLLDACNECGLLADDGESACLATIRSGLAHGAKDPAKTTEEMFAGVTNPQPMPSPTEPYTGPIPLPGPAEDDYDYEEPTNAFAERSFSAATLAGKPVPDRDWFIRDWVPNSQVTMIYGDGGVGKSLVAIHMAACSAAAVPWFARPVKYGNAIFMTAEDSPDEIHIRLAAISREHGIPLERMARLFPSSFADTDAVLASLNGENQLNATKLYDELVEVCEAGQPSVVMLDTLADIYGANENVRQQVRAFVAMLRKIAIRFKCAVVVLAHPSLSGLNSGSGTGGSTAWNNSIRSRLYFDWVKVDDGPTDPDLRVLKLMKSNYSKIGTEIHMRYQRGAFVADRARAATGDPLERQAKADRVFLELLEKARGQNINLGISPNASNYAPKHFKQDAATQLVSYKDLQAAMKRLMDSGRIINQQHGPASKPVFYLRAVE
jgi:RecA-family ATPase